MGGRGLTPSAHSTLLSAFLSVEAGSQTLRFPRLALSRGPGCDSDASHKAGTAAVSRRLSEFRTAAEAMGFQQCPTLAT